MCVVKHLSVSVQTTLERSETETRQHLNNQIEKQEREIAQLQKKLEQEVEQRHMISRNQEVSTHCTTQLLPLGSSAPTL